MSFHGLVLRFETQAELAAEYAQNWSQGRAFVSGVTHHPLFSRNVLLLEHTASHASFEVPVEIVMVMSEGPMVGSALQFVDRSESAIEALACFVNKLDDCDHTSPASGDEQESEQAEELSDESASASDENEEGASEADEAGAPMSASQQRQQKLRDISVAERFRVARGPSLEDRTLLERIYGSAVWEALLRNPKITVPEVARMARKGTMPRTLLDLIVENDNWIRQSVVRRGLLANPRLSPEAVAKVLRTLSARELKLVPQQTAYPPVVRTVAQRLMRGS